MDEPKQKRMSFSEKIEKGIYPSKEELTKKFIDETKGKFVDELTTPEIRTTL